MKLATILIGGAALVGLGVYLSKKFNTKIDEDESFVYAEEKETRGQKIRKASMYAVGAIKTSADKIAEGIKDIRNQDMVKKGEETIDHAKEAAGDFAHGVKEKVVNIVKRTNDDLDDIADDIVDEINDISEGDGDFFVAASSEEDDDMQM